MGRFRLLFTLYLLLVGTEVIFSREMTDPIPAEETDLGNEVVRHDFRVIDQKYHGEIKDWLLQKDTSMQSAIIIAMGFEGDSAGPSEKKLAVIILNGENQPEKIMFTVDSDFYLKYSGVEEKTPPVPDVISETVPESTPGARTVTMHPQDGRLYFMINTTVRSAYIYPFGIMTSLRKVDGQVTSGLSLLSIGATLYGSYAFSRSIELGYGRVEFMNYGGDMGGQWIPILLQTAIAPDPDENRMKIQAISGMVGFPLGIFIGSKLSFADNYAYGNASMMTNLSRFAPLYGFGLTAMATRLKTEDHMRIGSALSLGLIPAGFYIGKRFAGDNDIASGRSIMTLTGGIGGAVSGVGIVSLFEYDLPDLYFASAILGHIAGTAFGFNYHSDLEHTFAQGTFTAVSSVIGSGLGLSIPLLASADNHRAYTVAGMLGCWGGFFLGEHLSLSLFEKDRHDNRTTKISVSFPGLASIPFLVLNQQFAGGNDHSSGLTVRPEFWSQATLLDVRF